MGLCNIGKSTICDIKKSENKRREFTSSKEQYSYGLLLFKIIDSVFFTHSLIRYFRLSERFANLFGRRCSDKWEFTVPNFVNFSISSLGIFGLSCSSFIEVYDALAVVIEHRSYLISKLSNTIIRTTYYIFLL